MGNDHSHILEAYKRRVEAQAGRAISDEEIIESLERRPPNEIIDLNSCGQHLLVEAKKHVDEQVRKLREFYEKREFIAEYGNKLLESLDAKHRDTQNAHNIVSVRYDAGSTGRQLRFHVAGHTQLSTLVHDCARAFDCEGSHTLCLFDEERGVYLDGNLEISKAFPRTNPAPKLLLTNNIPPALMHYSVSYYEPPRVQQLALLTLADS